MLLRRVSQHIQAQNWFAVAIDFVIVVVGVFMGLQVQEWNQQRTDRSNERAYLERLSSDFEALDRDLRQCLATYKDGVDAIKLVSRVVDAHANSEQALSPDRDTFSAALIRLSGGAIPAGRSTTFVEMMSSGDLSILTDEELRNALIVYDQRAQTSREAWRSVQDQAALYQSPLYQNIGLDVDLDENSFVSIRDYDLEAMASDSNFHSMLNVFAGSKANNYELCQRQLASTSAVRSMIEESRHN